MKIALRRILSESARLDVPVDSLTDDADLYAAGLSSLATVHLMLAMEDEFNVEIPDRMLTRRLFSSWVLGKPKMLQGWPGVADLLSSPLRCVRPFRRQLHHFLRPAEGFATRIGS